MNDSITAIQPVPESDLAEQQAVFDRLVDGMAFMVAPSTLRVYRHTYSQWRSWCADNAIGPLALWPANAGAVSGNRRPDCRAHDRCSQAGEAAH